LSSCSQQQKWILSLASLSEDPQSQVSKQKPFQILSLRTSSYQTRPSTLGEAEPRRRIGQAIGVRKHSLGSLPPSFSFTSTPPQFPPQFRSLLAFPPLFVSSFFCICISLRGPSPRRPSVRRSGSRPRATPRRATSTLPGFLPLPHPYPQFEASSQRS